MAAPSAPTNLRVEAVTDTSARVRWDAVAAATDYDVNYRAEGGRWTNHPHPGTTLYTTLDDLKPNTAYRWAVRAENSDGYSNWVFGARFTTLAGEPGQGPNLTIQATATPATVESGDQITIRATVRNDGNARAESQTIVVYRHTAQTDNPRVGGTQVSSGTTGALAPSASVTRTARTTAPTVSTQTTYHYYVCIAAACDSARVTVSPEEPVVVQPEMEVMGGDTLGGYFYAADNNYIVDADYFFSIAATLTLGGLTTTDGTQGFVMSGHTATVSGATIFEGFKERRTDTLIFGGFDERTLTFLFKAFLGKVMRLPHVQEEGRVNDFIHADAAFVAYPSLTTTNCSLTWTGDDTDRTYCLDLGRGEQVETVTPLAIRGKHNATYAVVGSQSPTMGLEVMFSGGSGTSGPAAEGNRVTSGAILCDTRWNA